MKKYYASIENGIIQAIGDSPVVGEEVSEEFFNRVEAMLVNGAPDDGKDYRISVDFEWVKSDDPEPDLTDSEILAILLGEGEEE